MEENTMKAEELRIGNFIGMNLKEFPENWFRVLEPATHSMKVTDDWNRYDMKGREVDFYDADLMEGIPLTPEWLERFRFEFHHDGAYNETIYIKGLLKPPFLWGVYPSELGRGYVVKNSTGLHYVHQLQNLYFALTGQELTLKP